MAKSAKAKKLVATGLIAENRRARFDYEILDTLEAGLVLTGTEVRSLRNGKAQIAESYASPESGELFLINSYIPEYVEANRFNHNERRPRKLLVSKRELGRLMGAVQKEGQTIVPLKLYFNDKGIAKLLIGVAKGKKTVDKRQTERNRDWDRQKSRLLKNLG
ncbi:MAG: SsrA-binding protein SmpB [Hyphomicrobiaceae bacterium]|nr:SsrA-binding protein SmpB [Hyphomicrobiaceae bacterium]